MLGYGYHVNLKNKTKQNKTKIDNFIVILHLVDQVNLVRSVAGIFFVAPAARELGSDSCPEQHQLRAMCCRIRFGPSESGLGPIGPSALLSQWCRHQASHQASR